MNETDRTIVGLLWHENIVELLKNVSDKSDAVRVYSHFLDNLCFSDYIDRVTFQKQIWQFNELSSLMKTFYNNHLLHNHFPNIYPKDDDAEDIRFTKVLTKYSSEYNNATFVRHMCQQLGMDKSDMLLFFGSIDTDGTLGKSVDRKSILYETYDITKLDIGRIIRYLDKHIVDSTSITDGMDDM